MRGMITIRFVAHLQWDDGRWGRLYETSFEKANKGTGMIEKRMDYEALENLLDDAESTVRRGNKIIATALGKNVPICEKFVGTLISLGIDAFFCTRILQFMVIWGQ